MVLVILVLEILVDIAMVVVVVVDPPNGGNQP